MYKKRCTIKNNRGISPVLETLIAVGICISLLAIFFIATTNIFSTHERLDVDLEAKCVGIMEALVNSPGVASGYNSEWESEPGNVDFAGLSTTRTIAYGEAIINDQGEVTLVSYYNLSDSRIGIAEACFLAGTKIVLADESYKNIEDIKIGDMVKSFDDKTGKIADEKVTNVFHHSPREMGDYYLVINKQLKVTPNHMFYSNGKWICAGDLKIGDPLFYKSSGYTIYSIDKIFEKESTYNFEVEGNHNYFVALDKTDVLVHNANTNPGGGDTYYGSPTADFTWFDCDGPYRAGQDIFFNAENSKDPDGYITQYHWWWNWDPSKDPNQFWNGFDVSTSSKYYYKNLSDDTVHYVRLTVIDDSNYNGTCIYTVQANKPAAYEIEPKPWVLTSKNIYPETGNGTFAPYGEGYNIKYTSTSDDNYTFEVKEKNKPPYTVLDSEKIQSLNDVIYYNLKSALGFDTTTSQINFNISIVSETGVYYYGANYSDTDILRSVDKEILIYHGPEINDDDLIPPYYEKGQVTVRVFLGGTVPNYPPRTPSNPFPPNNDLGVKWNVYLSWTGGDTNPDDIVTYDVYFGANINLPWSPPPQIISKQSATTYDPNLMPGTKYCWGIRAWDGHGLSKLGPWWNFTTKANTLPNPPANPNPIHESTNVNVVSANLTWTCRDDDVEMGDKLTYDVWFGKKYEPLFKISCINWDKRYFDPKENCSKPDLVRLDYNTKYYWQIGVRDLYMILQPPILGPKWNFWTVEKGLDQYSTYSSGNGHDTIVGIGQTFIAGGEKGESGNLSSIKLSLKNDTMPPRPKKGEDILIEIYWCDDIVPITDQDHFLTSVVIHSFDDTSYTWKQVNFSQPVEVKDGMTYFVLITTKEDNYNLEYSQSVVESPFGPYLYGTAWESLGGERWRDLREDFMFKTYVFRPFMLDQYCNEQTNNGNEIREGLAQTFTADIPGDLMKINLSLLQPSGQEDEITVRIYKGPPREFRETDLLATTTIQGFPDTAGKFVWKQANFTNNPPYIEERQIYSIVVNSASNDYQWETPSTDDDYPGGTAYAYDPGTGKWDLLNIDMIFATFMDEIDT